MKIEGVILAAGYSSRANCNKLTLKLNNKTIIEKCIEGMYQLCSRIIVVGGYRVEEIIPIIRNYNKVELFMNNNFNEGMFSSIITGFKEIKGDRFFFIPGDYPLISKNIYENMLSVKGDIVVPKYNSNLGHPVLINGYLAKEVVESKIDFSLRDFINRKGYSTINVAEEGILLDVDTLKDYERILKLAS